MTQPDDDVDDIQSWDELIGALVAAQAYLEDIVDRLDETTSPVSEAYAVRLLGHISDAALLAEYIKGNGGGVTG